MWVGKPPKPLYLTSTSFLSVGKNSCRLCLVHMTDWSRFHVWNLFKSELIFFWHETPCGARHGQHLHFSVLNFLTIQNSFSQFPSSFPICVTKCFVVIIVATTSLGSQQNINLAFPGLASRGSRPQPEQQCPPNTWLGDPGCLCKRD